MKSAKEIIHQYYEYFNSGDNDKFLDLLHDDVLHDINQGERKTGKNEFSNFMKRMNHCYKENVKNITVMVDNGGQHGAAEFIVEGEYIEPVPFAQVF